MRVRRTTGTVGGSLRAATQEASSIAEKPSPAIRAADVEHRSFVMDEALFVGPGGISLSQRSTAAASTFVPRSDYMSVRTRAIRRTTCSIVRQQLMGRRGPLMKKSSGVGVANDCHNPDGYSSRSASRGATLDARSAGSNDAASTVARDRAAAITSVRGSLGAMP